MTVHKEGPEEGAAFETLAVEVMAVPGDGCGEGAALETAFETLERTDETCAESDPKSVEMEPRSLELVATAAEQELRLLCTCFKPRRMSSTTGMTHAGESEAESAEYKSSTELEVTDSFEDSRCDASSKSLVLVSAAKATFKISSSFSVIVTRSSETT